MSMQWNEFKSHVRHLSAGEQQRVRDAFELGKKMHDGQNRKSGEPYFTHPIAVAHMLADIHADAETIIAALLHDTVEDTDLTLDDVKREFGPNIHRLIEGVTKLSRAELGDAPNLDEQIETIRKIFTLMEKDVRIMVIKLVDRLHNMQTIEFLPKEKQVNLARETLDVFVKIADRLCMQDLRDELEALCLGVLEPDVFPRLSELREKNEAKGQTIFRSMKQRLENHFPQHSGDVRMESEHKSWDNLRQQLQTEGTAVTGVSSISIAFICDTVDTCYRVLGILHQMWPRESMSFQDFINAPAINGYRGLHTTLILEDGTRVRCKLRTGEMHEYARKGIATRCFGKEDQSLLQTLPWTERISPLAVDTAGRSKEFFETLQSDILGESIVIHGPGDQSVMAPKGSTALDGAFYLFGDDALRLRTILLNGRESRLDTPLTHSMSLNITSDPTLTVARTWVDIAKTGFATAAIRSALVKGKTDEEKIPIGKDLLQRLLTEHKKGFVEEFDERQLGTFMKTIGHRSMRDIFIAIADGHLDPHAAYEAFFPSRKSKGTSASKRMRHIVRYCTEKHNYDTLRRLLDAYQRFAPSIRKVRLWTLPGSPHTQFTLTMIAPPEEVDALREQIKSAGAYNIDVVVRTAREMALIVGVIVPWALNPVLAKWLLIHGMSTLPLITLRFLTFACFSVGFFAVWKTFTNSAFSPIRRLTFIAALPTLGNAAVTLFTYLALLVMPPSVHLTILRFNTFFLPTRQSGTRAQSLFLLSMLVLSASVALLLFSFGITLMTGIILSALTLLAYTFYSLSIERTFHQYKIDIRYPFLLLQMGLLLGVAGVVLLFLQPASGLWNLYTVPTVLYVLACVCIPHACYTALLKTTRFRHFTDLLLLEVPLGMAFETVILGIVLPPFAYGAIAVILAILLLMRWERMTAAAE